MLREQILIGDIKPADFVMMEEKELADEQLKRKKSEQAAYNAQTKRTDTFLEEELNRADKVKGMYVCQKCKSDNVN